MKVRCNCQLCSKPIEFDSADAGIMAVCPSCGMDTQLYVIKRDFQTMTDKAKGKIVTPADGAATTSTIFCSYLLAVFLSFFGFFAGIYLLFKKQPGHGIIVIVLSILAGLFWFLVMAGSALR